jgi:hypothetical protein
LPGADYLTVTKKACSVFTTPKAREREPMRAESNKPISVKEPAAPDSQQVTVDNLAGLNTPYIARIATGDMMNTAPFALEEI